MLVKSTVLLLLPVAFYTIVSAQIPCHGEQELCNINGTACCAVEGKNVSCAMDPTVKPPFTGKCYNNGVVGRFTLQCHAWGEACDNKTCCNNLMCDKSASGAYGTCIKPMPLCHGEFELCGDGGRGCCPDPVGTKKPLNLQCVPDPTQPPIQLPFTGRCYRNGKPNFKGFKCHKQYEACKDLYCCTSPTKLSCLTYAGEYYGQCMNATSL